MSFFGRVAARAGAPAVPSITRAVPKGMAARATLRRQEMPEEEEMQTLRRQEMPEEEEMQTLRRQEMPKDEEEMRTLRRQEMPEDEEMQTLRRQEEDEEPMQTLRRQDAAEEDDMQPLRRQEEEEKVQALRRQTVPPDAAMIEPETSPKPPSFSALPDEPKEMRGLRRDIAAGEMAGMGAPPAADRPSGADGGGADTWADRPAAPPFWPGEPSVAFEPGGFVPEPRGRAEARPRVVIEHMEVVISEPAGGGGGGRAESDLGRRLKSRYLRGL